MEDRDLCWQQGLVCDDFVQNCWKILDLSNYTCWLSFNYVMDYLIPVNNCYDFYQSEHLILLQTSFPMIIGPILSRKSSKIFSWISFSLLHHFFISCNHQGTVLFFGWFDVIGRAIWAVSTIFWWGSAKTLIISWPEEISLRRKLIKAFRSVRFIEVDGGRYRHQNKNSKVF